MVQEPRRCTASNGGSMARRRYQNGSLFLRGKNPVWIARYVVDEQQEGNIVRVRKSVVLGTKTDLPTAKLARRVLAGLLNPINSPSYKPRATVTFADFAERWRVQILPKYKPSTVADLESQLRKHLIPYFGTSLIHEVTTETIQNFMTAKASEVSPKRVRNLTITLLQMFKTARSWNYTQEKIEDLAFPRCNPTERRWFTVEEIKLIISEAQEPYATLYHLLAETGIRAGEAFALRAEDVQGNILAVRRSAWNGLVTEPKTKKGSRVLCISQRLASRIAKLNATTWLFPNEQGNPLNTNNILKRQLHPLLKRLGLVVAGFHAFRHANATILDSQGVPLSLREDRLGHADISTTLNVYTHVVGADSLRVADAFEDIFE